MKQVQTCKLLIKIESFSEKVTKTKNLKKPQGIFDNKDAKIMTGKKKGGKESAINAQAGENNEFF